MKKTHFREGVCSVTSRKGEWFWSRCGKIASKAKTTVDRGKVTCTNCLKKLGATRSEAVQNVAAAVVTPAAPNDTPRTSLFNDAGSPAPLAAANTINLPGEGRIARDGVLVRCIPNERGNPPGKLGDVELHFNGGGIFDGLKLIGFAVWERRGGGGRNVTFPARQYAVNGERRSFSLLRPITDTKAQERLRDLILGAWEQFEAESQEVR